MHTTCEDALAVSFLSSLNLWWSIVHTCKPYIAGEFLLLGVGDLEYCGASYEFPSTVSVPQSRWIDEQNQQVCYENGDEIVCVIIKTCTYKLHHPH